LLLTFLSVLTALADALPTAVPDHQAWNQLLATHILPIDGGKATVVNYQGMLADRQELQRYLQTLSQISESQFKQWSTPHQLAFLINAYNAWTVELILTAWPDVKSIKELGGLFSSPWRKKWLALLGKTRSLDDIEHDLIRGSGRYNDPRIHFAVNCASIGCPALRSEAYDGNRLDAQLDEQTRLFLRDRNRNRVDNNVVKLSSIFEWYREDFERGWQGFKRLEDFLLAHADALNLSTTQMQRLNNGEINIEFLDYDWRLNKQ
jgi:hypothetical protein